MSGSAAVHPLLRYFRPTLYPMLLLLASLARLNGADDMNKPGGGWSAADAKADSESARQERIQWWRDGRFGMFIHWGLYSIPAGVWKDKIHARGYSEWIMFGEKIPVRDYERLAKKFNPVKFDAREWAAIAKRAGMKYMVFTTKHHDGFSMFRSDLTPYNIVDGTPFKRDVTLELSEACRDAGVRFGCYYSVDRDWYRPQGPGNRYRQNNVWDYPHSTKDDFDRYFATFAKPQVEELLTRYRPDLLWFDAIDMKSPAQVEDLYQTIRRVRPGCLINSRIQGCRFPEQIPPPHCDYITSGDNEILKQSPGFEWENPGSMNTSFGYNQHDDQWLDASEIIFRLVDIVSKGGNYLLNVGPTSEGLIPQPSIDRLMEVGAWLDTNGEAIYGTSPWTGTSKASQSSDTNQVGGQVELPELRLTAKGNSLYVICLGWPGKEVLVRALGKQKAGARSIAAVRMLGSNETITWRQMDQGLELTVPRKKPCRHAHVYEIKFTQG